MVDYNFRNTILLAPANQLDVAAERFVLSPAEEPSVWIRPLLPGETIDKATQLLLEGGRYPTAAEAISAGKRWRRWLLMTFASHYIGIDIGDEDQPYAEPMSTEFIPVAIPEGTALFRDHHGLLVYPADPPAKFGRFGASATAVRSGRALLERLHAVQQADPGVSDEQVLAFNLMHSSLFDDNVETQFVLLVTAVEAILRPAKRSPEYRKLIKTFIRQTEQSDLPANERNSLSGYLGNGQRYSITETGRTLAGILGKATYDGLAPSDFFASAYSMRSNIVHGNACRPSQEELRHKLPALRAFVTQLLERAIFGENRASAG
ncbi:hypothetical protein [Nocardia africana]|uniref:hypothetical protein n=1 Tax=Nocardia africana TaxID=134964 RepID=UPI000FE1F515|nr:hypothetical protein [Nocardia africana]MCC3316495.1 hypothetical protein [Nocardia africana]